MCRRRPRRCPHHCAGRWVAFGALADRVEPDRASTRLQGDHLPEVRLPADHQTRAGHRGSSDTYPSLPDACPTMRWRGSSPTAPDYVFLHVDSPDPQQSGPTMPDFTTLGSGIHCPPPTPGTRCSAYVIPRGCIRDGWFFSPARLCRSKGGRRRLLRVAARRSAGLSLT